MAGRRGRFARRRCDDRGIRGRAARPGRRLSRPRRRAPARDPRLRCSADRPATACRAASDRSGATPRSPSPNCRRKPSIAANTSGCAARAITGAGTAPLSSCAPGKVRAWRCSTPRGSDTRSACRQSMYRARRGSRCLRRRRARDPARLVSESRRTTRDRPQYRRLARCPHRSRRGGRGAARRYDAAQLLVAIDRRARRRHRLLARNTASAARGAAVRARSCSPRIPATSLAISASTTFIARRPGWDRNPADGGAIWVHYGANIGASGGTLSLVSPDARIARAGDSRAGARRPEACAGAAGSGAERRDPRHPPRRRSLSDAGRHEPAVSSAAGSLAGRGRCRSDRADRAPPLLALC